MAENYRDSNNTIAGSNFQIGDRDVQILVRNTVSNIQIGHRDILVRDTFENIATASREISISGSIQVGNTTINVCQNVETIINTVGNVHVGQSRNDRKLKDILKESYQQNTLPRVSLLDSHLDLPIDEFFFQLQLKTTSNESIEIENIFDQVDGKKPLRILIEGEPWSGKTAIAAKLAHDWATGKDYIKHFELVFNIDLKHFADKSLTEIIENIADACEVNKITAVKKVKKHKNHTLFIIDGLEEFSSNQQTISELLYKQRFGESCVIALSRPDFETITKGKIRNDFHDKYIKSLGFKDDEYKYKFVKKFDEITKRNTETTFSDFSDFDSPLLLKALACKPKNEKTILTQTESYKQMINFIIRHGCPVGMNFDLFHFVGSANNIQELCEQFGQLSLEKILANDLRYECNKLTDQFYKIGFLSHHKLKSTYCFEKPEYYYKARHPKFVHFFAAFAKWINFKSNKSNIDQTNSELIMPCQTRGVSLVQQFFNGLILSDNNQLNNQSETLIHYFSQNIRTLLRELQLGNCANESYDRTGTAGRDLYLFGNMTLGSTIQHPVSNFTRSDYVTLKVSEKISELLNSSQLPIDCEPLSISNLGNLTSVPVKPQTEVMKEIEKQLLQSKLEIEKLQLQSKLEKLEIEKELLQSKLKKLEIQKELLQSKLEIEKLQLQSKLEKLEIEKLQLQSKLEKLEIEKLQLQSKLEKLEIEKLQLQSKLEKLEIEKLQLQSKLEKSEFEKLQLQQRLYRFFVFCFLLIITILAILLNYYINK